MADFRINVIIDPTRAGRGADRVERRLNRLEAVGTRVRATFGNMFVPLVGATGAIAAIRSIAEFENSLATAQAVTKATETQFAALRDRALELGLTTRFSARQAADSLVTLARAGFSVNESIESVDDVLRLAQAGGLALASAADIAATGLRGFRLQVDQAGRVTDVLVEAANSANTNVEQLGEGLKFVAPIAASLNRSIEETAAAMGVLSDAGLKATLAGTGLRRVLARLEAPNSELAKRLREAGIAANDVRPSMNDLTDILERLRQGGILAGESFEIFGQRGGPAFEVLVNQIPRIRELEEQLNNSGGAAERAGKIMDDTLKGAAFRAGSAINGLVLALGEAGTSDFLIGVLDGIAATFRVLADNADLLTAAVVGLAAALALKLAPALNLSVLPALRNFALSLVLARGNVLALIPSLKLLAVVNPFVAVAAAVAAATLALRFQDRLLKEIGQSFKELEQDAQFAVIGTQIRLVTQELKLLQDQLRGQAERGFGASDAQLLRLAMLKSRLAELRGESKAQVEETRRLTAAQESQGVTVENLLAKLDRQAAALRDITRETEARVEAEEEISRLLQAGVVPTPGEEREIENRIRRNQLLEDQRKVLESIRGPQQQFSRDEAALNALLEAGSITAEEFRFKLQDLKDELGGLGQAGGVVGVDQNSLDRLREATDLLQVRVEQGDLTARAIELENKLRAEGVEINRAVQDEIAGLLLKERELTAEKREQRRVDDEARRSIEAEARALQDLQERIQGTTRLAEEQERVKQLFADSRITADEYARALEDIQLRGLEASTSLEAGFERALIKLKREGEDLAKVGEGIVNVFADKATEAITTFVETGKFSFKDFARSILQDLTRILIRMLVVQAIGAALGAFGGNTGATVGSAAGGAVSGSRQHGGPVQPNRSFLVGENGPEIFQPSRPGTIIPNPRDASPEPAPVNVQVVNVQNEDEIPQAINDGRSDEAIVNALARNRDRVRQVIQ